MSYILSLIEKKYRYNDLTSFVDEKKSEDFITEYNRKI